MSIASNLNDAPKYYNVTQMIPNYSKLVYHSISLPRSVTKFYLHVESNSTIVSDSVSEQKKIVENDISSCDE